jgi:hypothetical protein
MKKEYIIPEADILKICGEDIMFLSISLSSNKNGDDDGGEFDELFG